METWLHRSHVKGKKSMSLQSETAQCFPRSGNSGVPIWITGKRNWNEIGKIGEKWYREVGTGKESSRRLFGISPLLDSFTIFSLKTSTQWKLLSFIIIKYRIYILISLYYINFQSRNLDFFSTKSLFMTSKIW